MNLHEIQNAFITVNPLKCGHVGEQG